MLLLGQPRDSSVAMCPNDVFRGLDGFSERDFFGTIPCMYKTIFLCCLALVFTSCSKLSVAVYWADTFAVSELDDYFQISSAQKTETQKSIQLQLSEIRKSDFPKLAELFEEAAGQVEKEKLGKEQILSLRTRLIDLMLSMSKRFEPIILQLMLWEKENNFQKFDLALKEKQEERWQKISSEEKRIKEARRRVDRLYSRSVGYLTDDQEKRLIEVLRSNPLQLEWENRNIVFQKFVQARPTEMESFLKKFFHQWESLQSAEYIKARDQYRKNWDEYLLFLLQNLEPKQKSNVIENLREIAAELRSLKPKE